MTFIPSDPNSNSNPDQLAPETAPGEVLGDQDRPSKTSEFTQKPAALHTNAATTKRARQSNHSIPAVPYNAAAQGPIQTGMVQNSYQASTAPGRPQFIGPYPNAPMPSLVNHRLGVPQYYAPAHPATHARPSSAPVAMGPAIGSPRLAMPHRHYTSSPHQLNAYQNPQFENMTNAAPQFSLAQPNFGRPGISPSNATGRNAFVNAPFNPSTAPHLGYGMQPGNYNSAGANTMLAITVQCPLGQPVTNNPQNAPPIQSPVAHPTNYAQGMPTFYPPHHWDFAPQGLFSRRPLFPNGSGLSQGTQVQGGQMQCDIKREPQENQLPSVKSEEIDATITGNANTPIPRELGKPQAKARGRRSKRPSLAGNRRRASSSLDIPLSGSAGPSTSSASSPKSGRKRPRVTSCYWDNCGMEVEGDADKLDYTRHLDEVHGFRGLASREITKCLWVDQETKERCGKELQIQSMIKHVCELHLNNLGMDCPMCGSYQARIGNMSRHWSVCTKYHELDEENQKKLWDEIISGTKGFDWYLGHKKLKE